MNVTQLIGDIIIAVLFALITWRHWIGFLDKFENGETTPLLLWPIWWGYAIALALLIANVAVCLFIIVADLRDIGTTRPSSPPWERTDVQHRNRTLVLPRSHSSDFPACADWCCHAGCGVLGTWMVLGKWTPILSQLKAVIWSTNVNYSLSIIPLFLLMGQFAARGGMSQSLLMPPPHFWGIERAAFAMAAVGACAGFGSICGSSLATAATMAQVALPELRAATVMPVALQRPRLRLAAH